MPAWALILGHTALCVLALRKIWVRPGESLPWQAAWSALVVLLPVLGVILFFGLGEMPTVQPKEMRSTRGSAMGIGHDGASGITAVPHILKDVTDIILDDCGAGSLDDTVFSAAAERYRHAALQGDVAAQRKLGALYGHGKGVGLDYAEAAFWLMVAGLQGDRAAQKECEQILAHLAEPQISDIRLRAATWKPRA